MIMLAFGYPYYDPNCSIYLTIFCPSKTFPKTVCFPSNHGHGTKVIKNYDPFVFGPALAMDNKNGSLCLSLKFSSANLFP